MAIITDECISCGRCVEAYPDIFAMGTEKAHVRIDDIPDVMQNQARQAAEACPVGAIILEISS
ncbi:MAG: ferredoxin [Sedimentisphaerales bacterium]|nr:ferredoxin [Sedimentisphaerales bacterium]